MASVVYSFLSYMLLTSQVLLLILFSQILRAILNIFFELNELNYISDSTFTSTIPK